jgi:hypothetical protein
MLVNLHIVFRDITPRNSDLDPIALTVDVVKQHPNRAERFTELPFYQFEMAL